MFGLFKREPKASPYDGLCDSLMNRPWEWTVGEDGEVTHLSGVTVLLASEYQYLQGKVHARVIAARGGSSVPVDKEHQGQVRAAFAAHLSARVNSIKCVPFDAVAKGMARFVLEDNAGGAYALADKVKEHVEGGAA